MTGPVVTSVIEVRDDRTGVVEVRYGRTGFGLCYRSKR